MTHSVSPGLPAPALGTRRPHGEAGLGGVRVVWATSDRDLRGPECLGTGQREEGEGQASQRQGAELLTCRPGAARLPGPGPDLRRSTAPPAGFQGPGERPGACGVHVWSSEPPLVVTQVLKVAHSSGPGDAGVERWPRWGWWQVGSSRWQQWYWRWGRQRWVSEQTARCPLEPGSTLLLASGPSPRGAVSLLGSGTSEARWEPLSPPGLCPPGNGGEVTAAASVGLPLGLSPATGRGGWLQLGRWVLNEQRVCTSDPSPRAWCPGR